MIENPQTVSDLQSGLVQAIREYVSESPLNRLQKIDGSPIWEEPLVGFADGDDPLFELYKTVVAPEHLTPREALAFRLEQVEESEKPPVPKIGVVSWILPAAGPTRLSNAAMTVGSSLRWNHSRFKGEEFNESLRRFVVATLEEQGCLAIAPVISPLFRSFRSTNGRASAWSERHMAYAAGLGTFGLSDGLITARGIAHRCGSVVANVPFVPTARPYHNRHEYCPYFSDGSCGVCIERCPVGAITPAGHDKDRCADYLYGKLTEWSSTQPGYTGSYGACGLCQAGVPCEAGIP